MIRARKPHGDVTAAVILMVVGVRQPPPNTIGARDSALMNDRGVRQRLSKLLRIGLKPLHVSVGVSNPCARLRQPLQFCSWGSRIRDAINFPREQKPGRD